jgi:hypothetical protein
VGAPGTARAPRRHRGAVPVGARGLGWANTFYSAAAQAGSESWRAFFFGSSDAASSITVDEPPAATGSTSAAGYQLASRLPVMAVGGFNGSVA